LEIQHPTADANISAFSAAALSDQYLAIAAPGRVMVFTIQSDFAGRWVVSYQVACDKNALIERMAFSSDGGQLLAILRAATGRLSQVKSLLFHPGLFPKGDLGRSEPKIPQVQEIIFDNDWDFYRPTGAAFSIEGTLAAVCTSHSGYRAGIQLLTKRDTGLWSAWGGLKKIDVFRGDGDQSNWTGYGLTGISLCRPLPPRLT
jgi:hypothetical protein